MNFLLSFTLQIFWTLNYFHAFVNFYFHENKKIFSCLLFSRFSLPESHPGGIRFGLLWIMILSYLEKINCTIRNEKTIITSVFHIKFLWIRQPELVWFLTSVILSAIIDSPTFVFRLPFATNHNVSFLKFLWMSNL